MTVHNLYAFANDNVPENGEERKDGRKGRFAIDDHERDMVDLETIREIADAGPALIGMSYDDDLVASIYQLSR